MTTVGAEELQRAAEELSSFQSFMAPSLDTPTTAASSQPPEMPVDSTSKRTTSEDDGADTRAKWHRGQGKGTQQTQPKPKGGTAQQQEQKNWWGRRDNRGYNKDSDLKSVVKALGRLVLRQEDSLSVIQLDCQFVIFMKNHKPATPATTDALPDWTVTAQLLSVGNHWKSQKERDPKSLTQPLRTVLFSSWLTAIRYRIDELSSKPATKETATAMGILDNDHFPYMQWNPEESRHVKVEQAPLSIADALQTITQLQRLIIHPNTIGRFHPLRRLTPEMASEVIPWTLDPKPNTGSPSSLPADRQTGSKRGDPPCILHSPPEQAGTLPTGNSGGQNAPGALRPVQSALLQLALVNPNSFSYANASLISVLWASSCSQVGLCVHHAGLFKFLQWLASQRKPQPIWDNIVFRNVMRGWQQPLRPHDPAAFLQHLQPMIFSESEGQWQARIIAASTPSMCEVAQSGHAWQDA